MQMTCSTLKSKGAQFTKNDFFMARIFLRCSAVVGLYTLFSALKREIGAFSGKISGISLSSTCLSELGKTQGSILPLPCWARQTEVVQYLTAEWQSSQVNCCWKSDA